MTLWGGFVLYFEVHVLLRVVSTDGHGRISGVLITSKPEGSEFPKVLGAARSEIRNCETRGCRDVHTMYATSQSMCSLHPPEISRSLDRGMMRR
jgi:hypothetical protein